jgi:hypothetical protein
VIEELHLLGVFMPSALVWGVLAAIVVYLLRAPLQRLPVHDLLWHPGLFELALFFVLWWGLGALADTFLPVRLIS